MMPAMCQLRRVWSMDPRVNVGALLVKCDVVPMFDMPSWFLDASHH
jgi:hypothetical protein